MYYGLGERCVLWNDYFLKMLQKSSNEDTSRKRGERGGGLHFYEFSPEVKRACVFKLQAINLAAYTEKQHYVLENKSYLDLFYLKII